MEIEERDALRGDDGVTMLLAKYLILSSVKMKHKRLVKISKELDMEPCSVGRWAAEMEADGLVTVTTDRRDKRAKLVTITPGGAKLYKSFYPNSDSKQTHPSSDTLHT